MTNIYSDEFYAGREELVRRYIGDRLDSLKSELAQLDSPCASRLMALPSNRLITIEELLGLDSPNRQRILSALLYNDAYWRLEGAYLNLCIGMLNITYSNLRSCLETVIAAHIIENLDSEAKSFLTKGKVNQNKISDYIPTEYNQQIKEMKRALSERGVHTHLRSIQLSSLFGPNAFDRMLSRVSVKHEHTLNPDFVDAAKNCITAIGSVFLVFMFLMHKGTTYRAQG